ncbi:MAG: hypothetical protein PVI30_08540 [Myxococcales bacterium]|jgi:alpha-tubulin suppressor-like RCC1 family protein
MTTVVRVAWAACVSLQLAACALTHGRGGEANDEPPDASRGEASSDAVAEEGADVGAAASPGSPSTPAGEPTRDGGGAGDPDPEPARAADPDGGCETAAAPDARCDACRDHDAGWSDCNGDGADGCEVNLLEDPGNCGACGVGCSAGELCDEGACVNPDAVRELTGGRRTACVAQYDGDVLCWGRNSDDSYLGDPDFTGDFSSTPRRIPDSPLCGAACACDSTSTCDRDGSAHDLHCPCDSDCTACGYTDVSMYRHGCAVTGTHDLVCWGDGTDGGKTGFTDTPHDTPRVLPGTRTALQVAAGTHHSCARVSENGYSVQCWGAGSLGQLGNDLAPPLTTTPVTVQTGPSTPLDGIEALAAGEDFTCALRSTGEVFCWGSNTVGQLGFVTTADCGGAQCARRARPVALPAGADAVEVSAGQRHACARLDDGRVLCWGDNTYGQLATGSSTSGGSTPVQPLRCTLATGSDNCPDGVNQTPMDSAISLTSGRAFNCILHPSIDGAVPYCWGRNTDGQVAPALAHDDLFIAVRVAGASNAVDIAAGDFHVCSLISDTTSDHNVQCWGEGDHGQIGNGCTGDACASRTPPTVVSWP